jgi:NADH-quinone oxidoreductase subunit E/NADP-reducing hydrogenase subunit HndA
MINVVDNKLAELKATMDVLKKEPHCESQLIAILHKMQQLYGYLDQKIIDEVAVIMNIPTAHIWGVATFYHLFNLSPQGKHIIFVCLGTACYVKGAPKILETIKKELNVGIGETTEDRLFTLQEARCLGACGLAPVIMIDDKIYGALTPKKVVGILQEIRKQDEKVTS